MSLHLNKVQEWNVLNKNVPFQNAVTQNDLVKLCKNWNSFSTQNFHFNHVIDKEPKVTNQKSSGRCFPSWLGLHAKSTKLSGSLDGIF